MDNKQHRDFVNAVIKVLSEDERILFAYLYGSTISGYRGNDIDIAVYAHAKKDTHRLLAELKIAFYNETGMAPDAFDVRILNGLDKHADIFGLLYLKNVVEGGRILINKEPDVHFDFLERYGSRFLECEGLMQEVLA